MHTYIHTYIHTLEIRDCGRYLSWLEKLQNRATSLVAKSIRELLEKASRSCVELQQQVNMYAL